jgi:hypothetical protein
VSHTLIKSCVRHEYQRYIYTYIYIYTIGNIDTCYSNFRKTQTYILYFNNSYKPITNTAWVRTRLCKWQKRVHSTCSNCIYVGINTRPILKSQLCKIGQLNTKISYVELIAKWGVKYSRAFAVYICLFAPFVLCAHFCQFFWIFLIL